MGAVEPTEAYDLYIEPTVEGYQIGYVENVSALSGEEKDPGVIGMPQ